MDSPSTKTDAAKAGGAKEAGGNKLQVTSDLEEKLLEMAKKQHEGDIDIFGLIVFLVLMCITICACAVILMIGVNVCLKLWHTGWTP